VRILSSRFQQKRKYLVGVLVLALIVSVSFNLYNHFVVIPKTPKTLNNIIAEVLRRWMSQMMGAKNILESAETNFDAYDARSKVTRAYDYLEICRDEIGYSLESFYGSIRSSTRRLWDALDTIFWRNASPDMGVTTQNLTEYDLSNIEDICQAIDNIYLLMKLENSGVNPVQQLEEQENLTDIIFSLRKIKLASQNIILGKY